MNTTTLIFIVGTALILTLVVRFALRRRVRLISPRSRYTTVAILLGVGVSAEVAGAVIALVGGRAGVASLFIVTALFFGAGCVLEMQKLSREF